MYSPLHNLNPHHRDALRSVLERKHRVLYANERTGFFHSMSIYKKLGLSLSAVSMATGIAVAGFALLEQPGSTQDFFRAAQAAYESGSQIQNGILHQQYIRHLDPGTPFAEQYTVERWSNEGNIANVTTFADGTQSVYMEKTDAQGVHRGYVDTASYTPVDPEMEAGIAEYLESRGEVCENVVDSDTTLSADARTRDSFMQALNIPVSQSRAEIIETLMSSSTVEDLGETNGVRSFRVTTEEAGAQLVETYAFDANSYALRNTIEQRVGTDKFGNESYRIETEYTIDEILDMTLQDLPIFADMSSLTEIQLLSAISEEEGCYTVSGERRVSEQE